MTVQNDNRTQLEWIKLYPDFKYFPDAANAYLYTTGLAADRHNFSLFKGDLMMNGRPVRTQDWEKEKTPRMKIRRLASILHTFSWKNNDLKGAVLVYGVRADFYAGFLATIWPECTLTAVSIDPITENADELHFASYVRKRIRYASLEEISDQTFDSLVAIDLGNVWLYDRQPDAFYTLDEYSKILSQSIEEKMNELLGHVEAGGVVSWVHENISTMAYAGWLRSILSRMPEVEFRFHHAMPNEHLELDEISLMHTTRLRKTPLDPALPAQFRKLSELLSVFWKNLAEEAVFNPSGRQDHFSNGYGLYDQLDLETEGYQPVWGNEYEVRLPDGRQETIRDLIYAKCAGKGKKAAGFFPGQDGSFGFFSVRRTMHSAGFTEAAFYQMDQENLESVIQMNELNGLFEEFAEDLEALPEGTVILSKRNLFLKG